MYKVFKSSLTAKGVETKLNHTTHPRTTHLPTHNNATLTHHTHTTQTQAITLTIIPDVTQLTCWIGWFRPGPWADPAAPRLLEQLSFG